MRKRLHTTVPRVIIAFVTAFLLISAGVLVVLLGFAVGRGTTLEPLMGFIGAGMAVSLMLGVIPVWFMGHVRAVGRRVMPLMFGILLSAVTYSTFAATGRGFPQNLTEFEPWGVGGIAFAVGTMAVVGLLTGAVVWTIAYPRAINEDRLKHQAGMFD